MLEPNAQSSVDHLSWTEDSSPLLSTEWFLGAALVGLTVTCVAAAFFSTAGQFATLGTLTSVLAGVAIGGFAERSKENKHLRDIVFELQVPLTLQEKPELLRLYQAITSSLVDLAREPDSLLQELAIQKIATFAEEIGVLAEGRFVFFATETWRRVYERVLRSLGSTSYYSVAWVRDKDYWQDQAGRQSMKLNFELISQGYYIERTVILSENLWPKDTTLPAPEICSWLLEQERRGIRVRLVRELDLQGEPELLRDIGIYGGRAVGEQELDHRCRTSRFTLYLDPRSVRAALDRWERLNLFASAFSELSAGTKS